MTTKCLVSDQQQLTDGPAVARFCNLILVPCRGPSARHRGGRISEAGLTRPTYIGVRRSERGGSSPREFVLEECPCGPRHRAGVMSRGGLRSGSFLLSKKVKEAPQNHQKGACAAAGPHAIISSNNTDQAARAPWPRLIKAHLRSAHLRSTWVVAFSHLKAHLRSTWQPPLRSTWPSLCPRRRRAARRGRSARPSLQWPLPRMRWGCSIRP